MNDMHPHLACALAWAQENDSGAIFDTQSEAVLAQIQFGERVYDLSAHMIGEALVLCVANCYDAGPTNKLELYESINDQNATWSHGAYIVNHELSCVIHRDSLEPGEEDVLDIDDINEMVQHGIESLIRLMTKLPKYFHLSTTERLAGMPVAGTA